MSQTLPGQPATRPCTACSLLASILPLALLCSGALASHCEAQTLQHDTAELEKWSQHSQGPLVQDWLLDNKGLPAGIYQGDSPSELVLSNGLATRRFRLTPNLATVSLKHEATGNELIRAVEGEGELTLNGLPFRIGGLDGQPDRAFIRPEWLEKLTASETDLECLGFRQLPVATRLEWHKPRHHAPDIQWPPQGVRLRFEFRLPTTEVLQTIQAAKRPQQPLTSDELQTLGKLRVFVDYELYDGLPCFVKRITVTNPSDSPIELDRLVAERLSLVEHSNWVETREGVTLPEPRLLHVETDFAFGGFNYENANRHVVRWLVDPSYTTQVNYLKQTPCLLEVAPTYGPAQTISAGQSWASFHTFELLHDEDSRERRSLALKRMYRTVAPWVTENPLMMHLRTADPEAVRSAIKQCREVGFEMLILSFGSGFNIEDESAENLERWRELNALARENGIELGGYSLLSSRSIGNGQDIVSPEGQKPTHGNCPALTSEWGQNYFATLQQFFETTGFQLLEHDGSYPGDVDTTPRPPLQKGAADSRWAQWRVITDYYHWCRSQGIYLNVPDYYYLSGSNKCGMGYREVNWSLPRDQQVIHTRQNIFDGTRRKTPSMGWMFVPLTEYHGGGPAATIEPLSEHQDHYGRMLASNLGAGVQACYRGPRLFDSDETRDLVRGWVDWFKSHRDILESDVIHSASRRADGRDIDWLLHANPNLKTPGMLVVYNPLTQPVTKTIVVDLYYTGLVDACLVTAHDGPSKTTRLNRQSKLLLEVTVPPGGMSWYTFAPAQGE